MNNNTRKAYQTESILADGHYISNNTWETQLNCNQLVLGPSGTGKTRNFLKPNLLQMNASYLVLDTKGLLYKELGPVLEANGYTVQNLDFTSMSGNVGYNPLDYIHWDEDGPSQKDILSLADVICPIEDYNQPFWDHAAANFFASYVAYVLEVFGRNQTLADVIKVFEYFSSDTEAMLENLEDLGRSNPDSFAYALFRRYRHTIVADKMYASILGILAEKVRCLAFKEALDMYSKADKVSFARMGHEKITLFVTVSDADYSLAPLTNLFITQAFQELLEEADSWPGGMLPVPVRLFLDDFSNLNIPNFEKIISVTRSREIWCTVLCQTMAQLVGLYGNAGAETIVGNCDVQLVLAFQDRTTAGYYAQFADRTERSLLATPLDKSWLFVRGRPAERVAKYDVETHPALLEYQRAKKAASETSPKNDPQAA